MSEGKNGLPTREAALFRRRVTAWFAKHARDLPWRRTADPYAILVSEIMCQQTQVATVIPYFERWMRRFPDCAALAAATEQEVMSLWQGLGYYSRARNLHRAAQAVLAAGGVFPRRLEAIRALPGVGRYTAGAVSAFAYDEAVPLVDANVGRVLARVYAVMEPLGSGPGAASVWAHATALQPPARGRAFNAGLMELGALLCTPRNPRCGECPVADLCAARARGLQPELPARASRPRLVRLAEPCALITRRGEILLEHQSGARWRGLWKLPTLDRIPANAPTLVIEYPFTHHKVTLSVYPARPPRSLAEGCAWHPLKTLAEIPLAAAHRRALNILLRGVPPHT